jgi:hypothetical protein
MKLKKLDAGCLETTGGASYSGIILRRLRSTISQTVDAPPKRKPVCRSAGGRGGDQQLKTNVISNYEERKDMSNQQDNRVLSRQLARDLTPKELEVITGGFFTNPNRDVTTTFCTLASDGDDD